MKSSFLQYKGTYFPYNPSEYTLIHKRDTEILALAKGEKIVCEKGLEPRRVSGKGVLFGKNAIKNYQKIRTLFETSGKGVLQLPQGDVFNAFFTELRLSPEAKDNVIYYEFSFLEAL